MKTEELMLGDYITFRDVQNDSYCPKVKVCGLINDDVYASIDGDPVLDVVDPDELAGIPLTPEILEKNGFENDFYEDESVADYVKVRLEGYSLKCKANGLDDALVSWCNGHLEVVTDFNGEVRKDIEYVHELQRALRICGIDKEITV